MESFGCQLFVRADAVASRLTRRGISSSRLPRPHPRPVHPAVRQQNRRQAELDALTAAKPPAEYPSLIDELPCAPRCSQAPDEIRAHVYAAFQVHALYRAQPYQATITDQTPAIIAALTADPPQRPRDARART